MRLNPAVTLTFKTSPKIVALFEEVKRRVASEMRAAPPAATGASSPAATEPSVVPPSTQAPRVDPTNRVIAAPVARRLLGIEVGAGVLGTAGCTLDRVLPKRTAVPLQESAWLVDALQMVHALPRVGLIDRDIRPHNCMVTRSGDLALIDFGIAKDHAREKLAATGAIRGALGYLSPEAVRGELLDCRADLFSVGALFYRLVCGVSPFVGRGPRQTLAAVVSGTFARPSATRPELLPLDAFFWRALAPGLPERLRSAMQMREALHTSVGALDVDTTRAKWAARVQPLLSPAETTRGPTRSGG